MAKLLKGVFYRNPHREEPQVIAQGTDKSQIISKLVEFVDKNHLLCSNCETPQIVRECLEERDYYLFLNPWELIIEEVN